MEAHGSTKNFSSCTGNGYWNGTCKVPRDLRYGCGRLWLPPSPYSLYGRYSTPSTSTVSEGPHECARTAQSVTHMLKPPPPLLLWSARPWRWRDASSLCSTLAFTSMDLRQRTAANPCRQEVSPAPHPRLRCPESGPRGLPRVTLLQAARVRTVPVTHHITPPATKREATRSRCARSPLSTTHCEPQRSMGVDKCERAVHCIWVAARRAVPGCAARRVQRSGSAAAARTRATNHAVRQQDTPLQPDRYTTMLLEKWRQENAGTALLLSISRSRVQLHRDVRREGPYSARRRTYLKSRPRYAAFRPDVLHGVWYPRDASRLRKEEAVPVLVLQHPTVTWVLQELDV